MQKWRTSLEGSWCNTHKNYRGSEPLFGLSYTVGSRPYEKQENNDWMKLLTSETPTWPFVLRQILAKSFCKVSQYHQKVLHMYCDYPSDQILVRIHFHKPTSSTFFLISLSSSVEARSFPQTQELTTVIYIWNKRKLTWRHEHKLAQKWSKI